MVSKVVPFPVLSEGCVSVCHNWISARKSLTGYQSWASLREEITTEHLWPSAAPAPPAILLVAAGYFSQPVRRAQSAGWDQISAVPCFIPMLSGYKTSILSTSLSGFLLSNNKGTIISLFLGDVCTVLDCLNNSLRLQKIWPVPEHSYSDRWIQSQVQACNALKSIQTVLTQDQKHFPSQSKQERRIVLKIKCKCLSYLNIITLLI